MDTRTYDDALRSLPVPIAGKQSITLQTEKTMYQTLYEVTLFDIRDRDVYVTQMVASSPDIAKMHAVAEAGWEVYEAENFDFFVREIGTVRNQPPKVEAKKNE